MSISLTEAAAERVKGFLAGRDDALGLRVGVTRTGCSGMAYIVDFAQAVDPEDQVYESNGVKLVVDPKSLRYIDGMEIDFVREGLNETFRYNNPNVKALCGCGESFNV